ncbi:MAG: Uma2 family endonuclease [Chloroflexi bacterium]|nr:Uma2 family endonuclease [Chloroflexota bacterium]
MRGTPRHGPTWRLPVAVTRPLTLDEFLLRPEEQPALEYERGAITQKMSPKMRHGALQMALCLRFESSGMPEQHARAFPETRVTWPAEGVSYVPDVIAYRLERVPTDSYGDLPDDVLVPPDVAVETPSPGQGFDAQRERCWWYVKHGVRVSLLVHADRRVVWVFRPGAETGPLTDRAVVDLSDVLDGCSFVVSELFEALRARPL